MFPDSIAQTGLEGDFVMTTMFFPTSLNFHDDLSVNHRQHRGPDWLKAV